MAKKNPCNYLLIQDGDTEKFEEAVNGNLAAKWKLYGPPFSHNGGLVQAMTFCEKGKK